MNDKEFISKTITSSAIFNRCNISDIVIYTRDNGDKSFYCTLKIQTDILTGKSEKWYMSEFPPYIGLPIYARLNKEADL